MKERHYHPVWIQHKRDGMTRYTRELPGRPPPEMVYSLRQVMDVAQAVHHFLRQVMDVAPPGKVARRKWALYAGGKRVWDVQTTGDAQSAIRAAEAWITGEEA